MAKKKTKKPAKAKVRDVLVWSAPDLIEPDRNLLWYLSAALIFIGLEATALFVIRDNLTALTIIVAAATLVYHVNIKPKEFVYMIDGRGFYVNDNFYSPSEIKYFWFSYEPVTTLHLEIKSRAMPISAYLHDDDLAEIRAALSKFAAEDMEKEEDAIARWVRILKL